MIDSLYIGATGLTAQQLNVDVISNNLANVNTPAYKKGRVTFEDLFLRELGRVAPTSADAAALVARQVGAGTAATGAGKIFTDGELKKSESPLDVAVRGPGFLEVLMPDGSTAYTRSGALQLNRDAFIATPEGHVLKPAIQVPPDAKDLLIDAAGRVSVSLPNQQGREELGQLELANFINPGGLTPLGGNLYSATDKSGDPIPGKPADEGFGTLAQGFLESSNVKLIEELVGLIVAQRAYEVNAKVVQAADEMLGISNNLRR